jgi:acyl transferase domain-containing protein/acyl carrier protein
MIHEPSTPAHDLASWLIDEVARHTGVAPTAIDVDTPIMALGVTSLSLVGLSVAFSERVRRDLGSFWFWEHASIRAAVDALATPPGRPLAPTPEGSGPRGVALVGLACRFPGAANAEEFWALLKEGRQSVARVPAARIALNPALVGLADETGWAGLVDGIDRFDPGFFGISPAEARQMDPQQRLALELCWEALEDAGVHPGALEGQRVGVFWGAWRGDYAGLLAAQQPLGSHSATGGDLSVVAGRISYALGLRGPSLTVATACSSSLVAVHLARRSLLTGEADLAVVGGSNVLLDPILSRELQQLGALSPRGRCSPFEESGDGYVRAEGFGVVVLQRQVDALRVGARSYCVLLGSAMNNDGASNGLTAPNPGAQRAVIEDACRDAGVSAASIEYVEAHGTGTPLGDPIEASALAAALGAGRDSSEPLLIGSVKGNIGHAEAAAGMAGLIKVALSIQHGEIPGTPNLVRRSSRIDFGRLGLDVSAEPRRFRHPARRAGVSSFGFSGTNAHVIAEAPCGEDDAAISAACDALGNEHDDGRALEDAPRIALVFNGQGGHWPGMGRRLLASSPTFHAAIVDCDALFQPRLGRSVLDALAAGDALEGVVLQWSAHFAIQYALAKCLADIGLAPALVVGHSIGEVAGAVFSEGLTLREGVHVIYQLAIAAERSGSQLSMLAMEVTEEELRQGLGRYPELEFAALNGPEQNVLVGPREQLQRFVSESGSSRPHHFVVGAGVHTRRIDLSRLDVAGAVGREPRIPFLSSMTGGAVVGTLRPEHWTRLISEPVRFAMALERAVAAGIDTFLELGPHGSLQRAIARCTAGREVTALSALTRGKDDALSLAEALAGLRERGFRSLAPRLTPRLLCIAARDAQALDRSCAALERKLAAEEGPRGFEDICYTANLHRTHHPERVAVVAGSAADAARALEARRRSGLARERGSVAFYFSGDGGQWVGMGLGLADTDPVFADVLKRCDAFTRRAFDWALIERLRRTPESETTEARQPLVVALQLALTESLRAKGVEPALVVGNSLGEIAAAFAAGALDLESAMRIAVLRSQLLARSSGSGGMALVQLAPDDCSGLLESDGGLRIAIEYLRSCVVSGPEHALAGFVERMKSAGVFCRRVNVSVAGHHPMLEPAARELVCALADMSFGEAGRPMWSTSLDRLVAAGDVNAEYFGRSVCVPVHARGAIYGLLAQGVRAIIEVGPHPVLQRSIEEILEVEQVNASVLACMKRDHDPAQPLLEALAGVYEHGGSIDWRAVTKPARRVSLPPHAWNHRSYWLAAPLGAAALGSAASAASDARGSAVGTANERAITYQLRWERAEPVSQGPGLRRYLVFADSSGLAAAVGESLIALGHRATLVYRGGCFRQRAEAEFEMGPDPAEYAALARLFSDDVPVDVVTFWPLDLSDEPAGSASSIAELCQHIGAIGTAFAGRARAACSITRGAMAAAEALPSPARAAVWAFVRSLELEWHAPFARIDLDVEATRADLRHVLDSLAAVGDGEEWAFRAQLPHRARLARVEGSAGTLPVQPDGIYWIIGGLGHVGLSFAEWLASTGARHVVLSSRTERSLEPGVAARLERLRAGGVTVEIELLDVADTRRVAQLRSSYGSRLRGVAHAAGLISHVPVERLTRAETEAVLRSKVDGVLALSAACPPGELDFFILFSSAAATWGASGLAHYAAANRFLDAFASRRGQDTISVGWGRWSAGGMVTAQQEALFDRIGLRALEPASAFAALAAAHAEGLRHVVIADADWSRLGGAMHGRTKAELCSLLVETSSPDPAPRVGVTLFDQWSSLRDAERRRSIEQFVENEVRAVLELESEAELGREAGLFDLGVDSVLSVRLAARLSGELGLRLSATAVLENSNVRRLAAHVWKVMSGQRPEREVRQSARSTLQVELERELLDCADE